MSPEFPQPKLIDFNGETKIENLTLKTIDQGGGAIGLGSDRIYQQLATKLQSIGSRTNSSVEREGDRIACQANSDV